MAEADPNYTFIARNKEIILRKSAVTAERLAKYFNFSVHSLYLKEEFGNRVEYPNQNGRFNLSGFTVECGFEVYGEDEQSNSGNVTATTTNSFSTITNWKPWGKDNTGSQLVGKPKATVKVVLAELKDGKVSPNTNKPQQSFVPLYSEDQANTTYITAFVNSSMKEEKDLYLVGSNGIEYTDEVGTRGIGFWKKGARKVFAIPKRPKRKSKVKDSSDESDDSDVERKSRKHQKTQNAADLQEMKGEISNIKYEISRVLSISNDTKVPIALKNIVKEAFECIVCKTAPMKTPIIASRCCGRILGCNTCIDQWYGTGASVFEKSCPHCSSERAYSNTFRLLGLDDFLDDLREICSAP